MPGAPGAPGRPMFSSGSPPSCQDDTRGARSWLGSYKPVPSRQGPMVRIHLPPAESPMRTSLASSSVSPSSTTTLSTSRSSTERAQISQMIERQAARECCTDRLARLASTTAWRPYPSIRLPRARATQSAAVPTSDRTGNDSRACRDRARRSR